MLTRIGTCNNCGACCYVYSNVLKHFHVCEAYTNLSDKHCTIYNNRPKECREFPRDPADLERVKQWCSLKFVDNKGRIVEGLVDINGKPIKLTLAP
jgi:hypothetical protein